MERVFSSYKEAYAYYLDNEDTVYGEPNPNNKLHKVFVCSECGKLAWGSHTSKHCSDPECRAVIRKRIREGYNERRKQKRAEAYRPTSPGYRIAWKDCEMNDILQKVIEESDAQRERREAVAEWNAAHCCPFFEGSKDSVKCFYCQRGINYAGASTLSSNRCPNNPIASDGSRYIQRAAYGKNTNCSNSVRAGKRYDYADNMPQHLKVQLVERMQRMGRKLYLWNNGHVDITPDPDSNN